MWRWMTAAILVFVLILFELDLTAAESGSEGLSGRQTGPALLVALVLLSSVAGLLGLGRRALFSRSAGELMLPPGSHRWAGLARRAILALATRRGSAIVVAGALGLGLALRLLTLGDRPLWVDEAGSWGYGLLDAGTLVHVMGRLELTPPGSYLAMKAWMALAGESPFWMRLPSALLGTAAILPFSLFLRRAFGPAAAAWGAVLLALAAAQLRYAQEARIYAGLFFLFALGLMLTERLVEATEARAREAVAGGRPSFRPWRLAAMLAGITGLMMHLHFTAGFAAATFHVYGLALLALHRQFSVRTVLPLVASGLGGLLLAVPVLGLALSIAGDKDAAVYWLVVPNLSRIWLEFQHVLLAPQLERLAVPGAVLSLLALGASLRVGWRNPQVKALSAAFVFALLVFGGISQVTPILMDRTILFTLTLYLAVIAAGLATLRRPLLVMLVAGAALLPQVKGGLNHFRSTSFYGEAWDSVATQLEGQVRPGEAILVIGAFEALALDYQFKHGAGVLRATAAVGDREDGVNTQAIRLMTDAIAVPGTSLPHGGLCRGLRGASAVWLVSREVATYPLFFSGVVQALRETGATPQEHWTHGTLIL